MKFGIITSQTQSGNILIKLLGKCSIFVYILSIFISHTAYVPLGFNSLALYVFVLFGILSFVFNKCCIVSNAHTKWYFLFLILSLCWVLILGMYWPNAEWFDTVYQMIVVLALSLSLSQFLESQKEIKLLCYAYALGAVLLMLYLAVSGRLHEDERLGTTIMGNPNIFADLYMTAAIMSLWVAVNGKNIWEKLLFWAAIVVIFYGLLLSGGRKFVLVPFVVLYIMLLLRKDKRGRNHFVFYTTVVIALFGGTVWLMMNNPILYESVGYRMEFLFNMIEGEGNIGSSNELRKEMRSLAFRRGFESPFWGHGFDAFKNLGLQMLGKYAYSHNNWTEIWYNYGLIGFVAYYGFYAKQFLNLWKYRKTVQNLAVFGIAIIASLFIYEYGAVSYFEAHNQMLLCLVAAICGMCKKEIIKNGKNQNISSPSAEG